MYSTSPVSLRGIVACQVLLLGFVIAKFVHEVPPLREYFKMAVDIPLTSPSVACTTTGVRLVGDTGVEVTALIAGGLLSTVVTTDGEVLCPLVSYALITNVWEPSATVVVSQV